MNDRRAAELLAKVVGLSDLDEVSHLVGELKLLGEYKYDHYQRFAPGRRFVESLALWLNQFRTTADREVALRFIREKLVFVSEAEFSHLVRIAYPDVIVPERQRLIALESGTKTFRVEVLQANPRFKELAKKTLYLGLSDGARTSELRRASNNAINTEQIWQAYELGEAKVEKLLKKLKSSLGAETPGTPRFTLVWLIDDFSGSGNTYIRYEQLDGRGTYAGKIPHIYDQLRSSGIVDPAHYEVYLLLYLATQQAIDHIQFWSERFALDRGFKPLNMRVVQQLDASLALSGSGVPADLGALIDRDEYYDHEIWDEHLAVGGTSDARKGFAGCALPVVLCHNSPNNSIYMLWAPDNYGLRFQGLFPRAIRHKEL